MGHEYCQAGQRVSTRPSGAWENRGVRRPLSTVLGIGLLSAAAYAVWRAAERRRAEGGLAWQARPFPWPPEPRERAPRGAAAGPWVDPDDDGECPATHPVKGKLASGIFHLPGDASYARTRPDRCYRSEEDAIGDGLRRAQR
jgi:hypothetical protein